MALETQTGIWVLCDTRAGCQPYSWFRYNSWMKSVNTDAPKVEGCQHWLSIFNDFMGFYVDVFYPISPKSDEIIKVYIFHPQGKLTHDTNKQYDVVSWCHGELGLFANQIVPILCGGERIHQKQKITEEQSLLIKKEFVIQLRERLNNLSPLDAEEYLSISKTLLADRNNYLKTLLGVCALTGKRVYEALGDYTYKLKEARTLPIGMPTLVDYSDITEALEYIKDVCCLTAPPSAHQLDLICRTFYPSPFKGIKDLRKACSTIYCLKFKPRQQSTAGFLSDSLGHERLDLATATHYLRFYIPDPEKEAQREAFIQSNCDLLTYMRSPKCHQNKTS